MNSKPKARSRGRLLGRSRGVKAAPDIFGVALERAGTAPEDAVVVGDSIWDIEAAKEAGVRVAAVMTGGAFSRDRAGRSGSLRGLRGLRRTARGRFP